MKRGSLTVSVVEADRRFYEDVGFKEAATEPKGAATPAKKPARRTRSKSAGEDA
jgi:hypothetical protein